jgi:hypothetical protein
MSKMLSQSRPASYPPTYPYDGSIQELDEAFKIPVRSVMQQAPKGFLLIGLANTGRIENH